GRPCYPRLDYWASIPRDATADVLTSRAEYGSRVIRGEWAHVGTGGIAASAVLGRRRLLLPDDHRRQLGADLGPILRGQLSSRTFGGDPLGQRSRGFDFLVVPIRCQRSGDLQPEVVDRVTEVDAVGDGMAG